MILPLELKNKFKDFIAERKKAENVLIDTRKKLEAQTWGLKKANAALKSLYQELDQKNKQLEKLDQLKSDFVSTVSHELRTPLSIIKEGISLVLDEVPGKLNQKQENVLNMSKDNIDRLARIINELLDISKIEAGKIGLSRALVDLSAMLQDICAKWQAEAGKKQQKLEISLPAAATPIYVDPDKITQVLNNLISNSIKYTLQKGRIDVQLKDNKRQVEVAVADTGVGIAKKDLPKVFSKFQQFSRSAGAGAKGTGLGLAICRELVQMHQGRIKVESEPNQGSRFIFTLPKLDLESVYKEHIDRCIREVTVRHGSLSLILIHLNGFDQLAKKLGLAKVENLLKNIEELTRNSLRRQADTVIRGKDELLVLLFDTKKENIGIVQDRIAQAINSYLFKSKEHLVQKISVDFGKASFPDQAAGAEGLLRQARGSKV